MKLLLNILLIILFHLPTSILAGEKGGNGGDAVVCRNERRGIQLLETLDSYEARALRGIQIYNIPESTSTEAAYSILMSRLSSISPKRAEGYKSFLNFFFENSREVEGELVDIPDSEHYIFPDGCKVEQLIIQQEPETEFDSRFLIQKNLWRNLNSVQKAIMILHEAFLHEAMVNKKKLNWEEINTKGVRYTTSLIFGFEYTLTEEIFVKGLLMIPNVYQGELKNFGEVTLRDKKGSTFWNAVKGFNENGFVDDLVLLPDPFGKPLEKKFGHVRFISNKMQFSQPRVKLLSTHLLRVNSQSIDSPKIYDGPAFLDRDPYIQREKEEIIFSGATYEGTGGSVVVDILKGVIVGVESYSHTIPARRILPLAGFSLIFVPKDDIEPYDGDIEKLWKINFDLNTRVLTYRISGKDLGFGQFHLSLKNEVYLRLNGDGLQHTITFNKEGAPMEDSVNISYIWNNKIREQGTWYPSREKEQQLEIDPLMLDSYTLKFLPEDFVLQWENLKRKTSSSISLVIKKSNRRKCIKVPKGSSWPIPVKSGWNLTNEVCH